MTTQRYIFIISALAFAAVLSGCMDNDVSGGTEAVQAAVPTTAVRVQDNNFDPEAIQVTAGDTVTWQWQGQNDHNVVADGFESPVQNSGSFEQRFENPGTYQYRCTLHGGMQGTVVVAEGDA